MDDELKPSLAMDETHKELAKLREFKAFVHNWLDVHGVPKNPDPKLTKATGCRIGPRLDYLEKMFSHRFGNPHP